jgi:hypothetical protein
LGRVRRQSAGHLLQLRAEHTFSTNGEGWCVSGPSTLNCGPALTRWIAAPFVPKTSTVLSSIDLALSYNSGTNGALISLRSSDASGNPGLALETWAISNVSSSITTITTVTSLIQPALQAGATYWLEVQGSASDSLVFWATNNLGLGGGVANIGSGWTALSGYRGRPCRRSMSSRSLRWLRPYL